MNAQRKSQYLALAAIAVFIPVFLLTQYGYFGPTPIGRSANDTAPLVVPAGPAFSIWGPIYVGLIVFAVYQFLIDRANSPRWVRLRSWFFANVLLNGLWLVAASYNYQVATVVIIVGMLYSLFRINVIFRTLRMEGVAFNFWLERLVFAVYFAWITLATALNVASALYDYGWDGWGWSAENWSVLLLIVVAAIAGYTAMKFRSAAYALTVVWAFVWLGVRHQGNNELLASLALVFVVLFALLSVILLGGWAKRSLV